MATAPDPSAMHVQRFSVPFEYPVVFTDGVLDPSNGTLAWALDQSGAGRAPRALFVADDGLAACWPTLADDVAAYAAAHDIEVDAPLRLVPGGEAAKRDTSTVDAVLEWIAQARLDRHAYVVALGGGAMLDAVGYAAALAHRGVRLIRIPTTVLAQNDAGVGVKNGINAFGSKNFLGTFVPPHAVLNDIRWIGTLPDRDRVAGVAEAIKVGLIRDRSFFEWLESSASALGSGEPGATATMIRRCAELHLQHIASSGDPFERGSARPLDYGHWSAHKLELLSGHTLRHGEAVSIGMLLDAQYAVLEGFLSSAAFDRVRSLLVGVGLPIWHDALDRPEQVLCGLEEFREHLGGELTITLLRDLGRGVEVHAIDTDRMRESIGRLRALRIAS
ncbi:MAG: 3-dehydroquinate synthase [Nannocystaceae bacterium]|nr:3-dehydroquinate synthase [bacterium]